MGATYIKVTPVTSKTSIVWLYCQKWKFVFEVSREMHGLKYQNIEVLANLHKLFSPNINKVCYLSILVKIAQKFGRVTFRAHTTKKELKILWSMPFLIFHSVSRNFVSKMASTDNSQSLNWCGRIFIFFVYPHNTTRLATIVSMCFCEFFWLTSSS